MAKRQVTQRSFDLDHYWDSVVIDSGLALASVTETIVVPKNSLIRSVMALIIREPAGPNNSTAVIEVGDDDFANTFLKSSNLKAAAGELYGNDPDHLGSHLKLIRPYDKDYTELTPETPPDQLNGKYFQSESNIVVKTTVGTAVLTRSAKVRVWVEILNLFTDE